MKPSYDEETLAAYFQPVGPETWRDPSIAPTLERLATEDPEVIAAVAEVDRSLIRACLDRTPTERLRVAAAQQRTIARLRRAL